jgi:hypothetical protein
MRWVAIFALVSALAAAGATAALDRSRLYRDDRVGLSIRLPAGWHIVRRRLTPCIDPVERLTVVGRGAMVMLQEQRAGGHGFPARPSRFALVSKPQPMECCAPLGRPGWFLLLRDGGRGFYAYVYLGGPGTRADALSILNSLRVRPRRG